MRSDRAVLEVLFPRVRAALLRILFGMPRKQRYVRELMRISELRISTVQDELRKLSAIGLLTTWSNGYHRFYRANRDHPLTALLVRTVQITARLPHVKRSAVGRRQSSRRRTSRQPTTMPNLRTNRAIRWGIFDKPKSF